MAQKFDNPAVDDLIPSEPTSVPAQTYPHRMRGLLHDTPKDETNVASAPQGAGVNGVLDALVMRMYTIASMLVGEGEPSVEVVEKAIAKTQVSPCEDAGQARRASKVAIAEIALDTLAERNADSLAAPEEASPIISCIDEDDLSSAGVSIEELEYLIEGPDRDLVRKWLMGLPTSLRAIFVLRAVAGFSTDETVNILAAHGGNKAVGWTSEAVRDYFRQGLCSLASQLIHSSTPR